MLTTQQTLLIGVDGGGTGCRAAIGTAAQGILGRADGGRANATSDPALAIDNVRSTIDAAARSAGLPPSAIETAIAHVGLAGVMTPDDSARIAAALPMQRCVVTDDRPTAVTGALGSKDGFLMSVGTGTIIATRKGADFGFVSGWGFQVSDQASGAWLGRAALEQVLLCHDGIATFTPLIRAIFAKFDNDPNSIVAFCATAKPGDYATLAPDIIVAARDGEPWGQSIMAKGADYLLRGLTSLGFSAGDTLCLSGGVGPSYADFLSGDILRGRAEPRGSALDGAFLLAKAALSKQLEDM